MANLETLGTQDTGRNEDKQTKEQ